MMLDLIILGLGVRIIANVVQRGRDRLAEATPPDPSPSSAADADR